ncbi:helix-turn-helix transcriptional regulator [Nitrospirillum sp. BR 11163]|uniref:helix-turn-helix transcriptional regulator n=1 Tax=Nitrospirillum sp. BR 11163 TaxID=3104323 RepID=UPI002AFFD521|nr:helix-turn-helix transcriptional regulator [Nitrospirillum sp. BR 11163]MEA1672776.1 helix-turn-helix transcriptional regulator [Nitrospirillum sp. BR 11163]
MGLSAAHRQYAIEESIADCHDIDHVSNAILQPLQTRLNACGAGFTLITIWQDRLVDGDLSIARGAFEALTPTYRNGMFHEDPLYRGCPAVPETLMRYVRRHKEEADRLKIYHDDFLRAQDIQDCMGIYFKVKGVFSDKIVSLSFGRSVGGENFSYEDRQTLGRVGTLLRLALSNIALRHEAEWLWKRHRRQENSVLNFPRCSDDGANWEHCIGDVANARNDDKSPIAPNRGLMPDECVAAACRQFGITDRERDIVALLQNGHSNLSMAYSLSISVRTVENHLRSLYAKTFVNSRTQLLAKINNKAAQLLQSPALQTAH